MQWILSLLLLNWIAFGVEPFGWWDDSGHRGVGVMHSWYLLVVYDKPVSNPPLSILQGHCGMSEICRKGEQTSQLWSIGALASWPLSVVFFLSVYNELSKLFDGKKKSSCFISLTKNGWQFWIWDRQSSGTKTCCVRHFEDSMLPKSLSFQAAVVELSVALRPLLPVYQAAWLESVMSKL